MGMSWLAAHWTDLAAIILVLAFMGLVSSALRESLRPGERRSSRGNRRGWARSRGSSETLACLVALDRRLSMIERRLSESDSTSSAATRGLPAPLFNPGSDASRLLPDRIAELAGEGRSPAEIAEIVEEPVGRVELVLNLRRATIRE